MKTNQNILFGLLCPSPTLQTGGKEKPASSTATYFLVYNNNGAESHKSETGAKINFTLKDLITELKAIGVTEVNEVNDLVVIKDGKVQIRQIQDTALWGKSIKRDFGFGIVDITLIDADGYISGLIYKDEVIKSKSLQMYYIGSPFNKMVEHLLPLTVATSTRLIRNYYRYYY